MKLKAIILENFRGYNNRIRIKVNENLTAFIGKNDVGKSTILEALEIFFNNEIVKIEADDQCVYSKSDFMLIGCVFEPIEDAIVIDESSSTTLQNEFLLNEDNELEVLKTFTVATKPTVKIYLNAYHPTNPGLDNLLEKKNAELKKLADDRGIDLTDIDERSNVALRQALWKSEAELTFSLRELLINKQDTKEIWSKLQHYLPTFALFRSDRPSKDDDCEVQDPMKIAVKQALEEVATELERIKTEVQEKARDTALRTLDKLKEMDDSLANQLNPLFREEPKWERLFKLSLTGDDEIPVNKRGSGVRRLILLNFFRAEAEQRQLRDNTPNVIYAIEEPETSQHPSNQELLIAAFLELSQTESCQVLITTHVPGLASLLPLEGLRYIKRDTENNIIIEFGSEEIYEKIATSLGISPDAAISTAKALIMVEGYTDVIFLRHASNAFKANGDLPVNLEEKQIIPIFTGGWGNLKHWINLKLIEALGKPWGVFLDSDEGGLDPSTIEQKKQQITELQAKGISAFRTLKREAENYLHADVIFSETGETVTFNDFDDVKAIVNDATSVKKTQVLERFWPYMNAEQIKERDRYLDDSGIERHELYEIIKTFLDMT